jgi:hypothetical protein
MMFDDHTTEIGRTIRMVSGWRHRLPMIGILLACAVAPAMGGGIAGTIRDANTSVPLSGIDLDLFDSTFTPVTGVNGNTDASGAYNLTPLPAGDYYLRADPTTAQGYVDQYHPGVFLKSQATLVHVNATGSTIVDFNLSRGGTISGRITDATTGLPIVNMDLDCYAWDKSYISSINAKSAADGSFTVGCFPPGQFYVRANPAAGDIYVIEYYNARRTLGLADPVTISATENVPGKDFHLVRGGTISGTIRNQANAPLAGVDLDVFDALGNYLAYSDALTAADGTYMLNAVEPGDYYVQADPTAAQGYVDAFYPGTFDMTLATLVHVAAGTPVAAVDITLQPGGTVSGRVTSAATGLPIGGLRVSVFNTQGVIVSAFGASTAIDGTFLVGAMPAGTYYVRSAGDPGQGLAFEFYGGVYRFTQAAPVQVAVGTDNPGKDISLDPGWWITGRVLAGDTHLPLANIDIDVLAPYATEQLGALSLKSDAAGQFTIGPVPMGSWIVWADPAGVYPAYMAQYYNHVPSYITATQVSAPAGQTVANVNFDLIHLNPTDAQSADAASGRMLIGAAPNPSHGRTVIALALPASTELLLTVHDVTGRQEAVLAHGTFPSGRHEIVWDGTDSAGRELPGGVHFIRLQAGGRIEQGRMLFVH